MKKVTFVILKPILGLMLVAGSVGAQAPDNKKAAAPAAAKPAGAPPPAAAGPATAPAAGAQPAPKPMAEMDQIKFFVGKWKCKGKQLAGPMGPEHPFDAMAESKMDGDGFYQSWTYEEKKSKEHMGLKVHGMWGWDAAAKKFMRVAGDNRGNWDIATAPGLEGDKIAWTGELSGAMGKMPFHHTFTKKGDKEWMYVLEIKGPDGKFVPASEVTCKK